MSAIPATLDELADLLDERTLSLLARRRQHGARRRGWWVRRALAAADVVGLLAAFLVTENVYGVGPSGVASVNVLDRAAEYGLFLVSLPVWLVLAKLYGLYSRDEERADHTTSDDLVRVFHLVTAVVWLLFAVSVVTHVVAVEPRKLLLFWAMSVAAVVAGRAGARALCRRRLEYLQNTIVVGAGDVGQMMAKKLMNHPEYGINVVGFVDSQPRDRQAGLGHLALLGDLSDLSRLVRLLDVERVIFAFSSEAHDDVLHSIEDLRAMDIQVDIVPRLFEGLGPSLQVHAVEGVPLVGLPPNHLSTSSLTLKRSLDLVVGGLGLLMLTPLLVFVAVLIKFDSRGPVFYRHERIGKDGRPFRLFKFRTMFIEACRGEDYGGEDAEEEFRRLMADPLRRQEFVTSYKLQNDPRVTGLGHLLRKTSLDELPQLFNVLLGDISLVGPRPVTEDELQRYGDGVSRFLSIRPGVTGYWQINGRSRLEYEDRVRLDLAYVSGWSVGLDLEILAKTIRAVFTRGAAC